MNRRSSRRLVAAPLVVALLVAACGSESVFPPPPRSSSAAVPPTAAATTVSGASPTPASAASVADAVTVGRDYVEALARGDWPAADAVQTAKLHGALPADTLAALWGDIVAKYGAFVGIERVEEQSQSPYVVVYVYVLCAHSPVTLSVAVDGQSQVAGFHRLTPDPVEDVTTSRAPYVRAGSFTDAAVTVGSAPWALPGTLSMPKGSGPFPAVVLVAGSGPNDRDETTGPNKPLRDLAWGLASAGIAVLRYDKRTLVYSVPMAADVSQLTVAEEVTDDAGAAVALLRSTPGTDAGRVFVVGHSLGGYLAPRLAAGLAGRLRGIALLEAPSRPLSRLILYQEEYLAALPGAVVTPAQLDALRAQVARAESPDLTTATPPSQLPLGLPAAYWLDLRTYDPPATAARLSLPMFFSQGGRDYQVPPVELDAWRRALAGRADVAFHEYPALDHLLFAGTGQSTPAEYQVPSNVAPELVADLAAWVKGA